MASPPRLPWPTYILPLLICHVGTQLSLSFQFAPGVAILYLPIPLAMAMIQWWGPRVLIGVYANAVLSAGLWGLSNPRLWPVYALPETLAVGATWVFFTRFGRGRCWFPRVQDTLRYILLGILPAACIDGFQVPGQLVLLGDMDPGAFWAAAWNEWVGTVLSGLAVAVPLLYLLTPTLEKRGWSATSGARHYPLLPETANPRVALVEVAALLVLTLIMGFRLEVASYWYVYAIVSLWIALRHGLGMAVLANSWIVMVTLVLPVVLDGAFPAAYSTQPGLVHIHIGLAVVCCCSTLSGSLISSLMRENAAHRETLASLNEEKKFTDMALDAQTDTFFLYDPASGKALRWNRSFKEISGYSDGEIAASPSPAAFFSPEDSERARNFVRDIIEKGSGTIELDLICKDGRRIPFEYRAAAIRDGQGLPKYLIAIGRDIADRKMVERALSESERRYRTLVEHINEGVWQLGEGAETLYLNPRMSAMLGYRIDEMYGRSIFSFLEEGSVEEARALFDTGRKGDGRQHELGFIHKDGRRIIASVSTALVPDFKGGRTGLIASVQDITERKRTEEILANSQRLESLGVLAGGIAHDFNNLLAGLFGNVDMARDTLDDRRLAVKFLDNALAAYERARSLTQQLLTFSKGGEPRKQALSLGPVLEEARSLALSGSNIECNIETESGLGNINADPNQMSQVFNNLLLNARQAMPSGGSIRMKAGNRSVGSDEVPGLGAGEYVEVTVEDQGVGIPEAVLPKVFDPFFSTKKAGSGLGLATCHSILRRHNGAITIESAQGKGTTVRVLLPVTREMTREAAVKQAPSGQFAGRVLVMDDEEVMRDLAQAMLFSLNLEVACAKNGEEAIQAYGKGLREGRRFDVVMLDLTVPGGLGGEQAMAEIRKLDPHAVGIVASGYADSPILAHPSEYGFSGKIEKPFRRADLGRALEPFLNRDNGGSNPPSPRPPGEPV